MSKYHSGKYCPIKDSNCRSDCVSLQNSNTCNLIDGFDMIRAAIEAIGVEIQANNKYNPAWDKEKT